MTKANLEKPNYQYWAKMYTWHFNASALLLNGIDPNKYRSIRLAENNIPSEFQDAQETYFLLRSMPWESRYKNYYVKNKGVHPAAVISIAKSKGLYVPAILKKAVESQYKEVIDSLSAPDLVTASSKEEKMIDKKESAFGNRERKTWQLATGILVRLYAKKTSKLSSDGNVTISASQLLQQMLDEAERLGISADGIKSFDRKITKALELLDEEKSN